jgi:UDP-3-O-[3-hydroxymyristoyl] N-acetylglucosamine deacetylase/3-hydroxyacyl-[acyl-carrier-protein] dehydratase
MKGQGMLRSTRSQRTIARAAEVRGFGFFEGADVTLRFVPADPDTGVVFVRTDLPGRPAVPARVDTVVPSNRRTTIRQGTATVTLIEHVMAALAGLTIDNCIVEIDAPECPGCDGSSRAFVEALDQAGIIEQDRQRLALVLEKSVAVVEGDAVLAAHPGTPGGLTLSYHLDYGRQSPISAQSFSVSLSPQSFREELAHSRTFLLETETAGLRAAGIGTRATAADLLIFGADGVIGNQLRYPDECVRHKVLDLVGDLALLGVDLQGFVAAHRSGHQTNHALSRRLLAQMNTATPPRPSVLGENGVIDIAGIMSLLPHRYPFLLVDRVLELTPGRRAVAIKNVSINEPFFRGHWPGKPIMPGVLIIEALAQAAGVLLAASVALPPGRVVLMASLDEVKLRRPVVPGDQIRLEVISRKIRSSAACVYGVATVDDRVAAEAKLRFVMVDTDQPTGVNDCGAGQTANLSKAG